MASRARPGQLKGSAGSRWLEDTVTDTIASDAFEGTSTETIDEVESTDREEPAEEASFVHTATDRNSRCA